MSERDQSHRYTLHVAGTVDAGDGGGGGSGGGGGGSGDGGGGCEGGYSGGGEGGEGGGGGGGDGGGEGVGCLTSRQHNSVSQGRVCSGSYACCHTEIEAEDQTCYLTQSRCIDTRPIRTSADPRHLAE